MWYTGIVTVRRIVKLFRRSPAKYDEVFKIGENLVKIRNSNLQQRLLHSRGLGENIRQWGYDLKIGNDIQPMKLVWIFNIYEFINSFDVTVPGYVEPDIYIQPDVKKAFSFLRPDYLRYMDKPFYNPDYITQVNLILDYHRIRNRQCGIDIFNLFDLIAFKMAIDDNRFEYINCEFHKLIKRTLDEILKTVRFMKNKKFDLKKYLNDKQIVDVSVEILDYLVYHFQDTIGYLSWKSVKNSNTVKLSDIDDIPEFKQYQSDQPDHVMEISATISNGNCSKVLYEIMTKTPIMTEISVKFEFIFDGEWFYSMDDDLLNNEIDALSACDFTINTQNSFNFVENFINWLKFSFGQYCRVLKLVICNYKAIHPYVFNKFHVGSLALFYIELNVNLVRMLKRCLYGKITLWNCRIANSVDDKIELMGGTLGNSQNIFKYLDELDNVEHIKLELEDHTIRSFWMYIETVMKTNELTTFQLKNCIKIVGKKMICLDELKFCLNTELNQIDVYTLDGTRFDFYESLNDLDGSDRDEFDICGLYGSQDELDLYQPPSVLTNASVRDEYEFYN